MNALETQSLTIGYDLPRRQKHIIATDLHLHLVRGELTCLIGPNGVGKSTLMRTLAGVQPALQGKVHIEGVDVHRLSPNELARRLSIVLTERPDVGLLTGRDVIALGRHPYTDWSGHLSRTDQAVVDWAVRAVGAEPIVGQLFSMMSDGQRQKIMIARALAQEPTVLLLDEPTAFLDLPRRVEVMQLLRDLARQTRCAVLLSTHDLDLALRTADRMWIMSADGSIQTGAPEDLVLNHAIETVFHAEGIHFDPHTGAFIMGQKPAKEIRLVGSGLPKIWTQRALERSGFKVTPVLKDQQITVTIDNYPCWHVGNGYYNETFSNIYDLIRWLSNN